MFTYFCFAQNGFLILLFDLNCIAVFLRINKATNMRIPFPLMLGFSRPINGECLPFSRALTSERRTITPDTSEICVLVSAQNADLQKVTQARMEQTAVISLAFSADFLGVEAKVPVATENGALLLEGAMPSGGTVLQISGLINFKVIGLELSLLPMTVEVLSDKIDSTSTVVLTKTSTLPRPTTVPEQSTSTMSEAAAKTTTAATTSRISSSAPVESDTETDVAETEDASVEEASAVEGDNNVMTEQAVPSSANQTSDDKSDGSDPTPIIVLVALICLACAAVALCVFFVKRRNRRRNGSGDEAAPAVEMEANGVARESEYGKLEIKPKTIGADEYDALDPKLIVAENRASGSASDFQKAHGYDVAPPERDANALANGYDVAPPSVNIDGNENSLPHNYDRPAALGYDFVGVPGYGRVDTIESPQQYDRVSDTIAVEQEKEQKMKKKKRKSQKV